MKYWYILPHYRRHTGDSSASLLDAEKHHVKINPKVRVLNCFHPIKLQDMRAHLQNVIITGTLTCFTVACVLITTCLPLEHFILNKRVSKESLIECDSRTQGGGYTTFITYHDTCTVTVSWIPHHEYHAITLR
jgi:hypothetical protein